MTAVGFNEPIDFTNTVIDSSTRFRQSLKSHHQEVSIISGTTVARYRVLVAGRLWAGKTTLVNTLCGTALEPDKEDIEMEVPQGSLLLHDSSGFQGVGPGFRLMERFLANRRRARKFSTRVHAIWYCICTDSGMHLSPADQHFFDNDIAQQVPVIVVFTRYRGLVTRAFADLRMTLQRAEAMEQRFEKARELLRIQFIEPLNALRFPPTAYVKIDDLLDESTTLEHLIQTTLALMTEDTLRPMVLSVRQSNLDACMVAAVSAAFDANEGTDLPFFVLRHYPHIWKVGL
ncbi:hypothetical protein MIND_00920200 [Mycena indigotica]|uniref:G domain-containing protein n=1 Tax=Mycena indigotica TaxID=2126181 RepID=A0A8H6SCG9_9AGAR|nr:uncharacterized protein MIND_00920200 [Mycena indigotica]KAF7296884.1 hypothetical protein MIND_00920200 [Mycena indigotica]